MLNFQLFINYSSSCASWAQVPIVAAVCESALVSWDSVYSPVHPAGKGLKCVTASLMEPKLVDFSVSLAFYLLLGWSGYFQTPYAWNQKWNNSLVLMNPFIRHNQVYL